MITNEAAAFNTVSLSSAPAVAWNGGSTASESVPTTVHEPRLRLELSTTPNGTVQPGDLVTVTLDLSHTSVSTTTGFDAFVTSSLPSELRVVPGTLDCTGGSVPADSCSYTGNDLSAQWDNFAIGDTGIITYQATVEAETGGQSLGLTGSVDWSSLPGTVITPQSTYFTSSVERTATNAPAGIVAYSNIANSNLIITSVARAFTDDTSNIAIGQLLAATGQPWLSILLVAIGMSVVGVVLLIRQYRI